MRALDQAKFCVRFSQTPEAYKSLTRGERQAFYDVTDRR